MTEYKGFFSFGLEEKIEKEDVKEISLQPICQHGFSKPSCRVCLAVDAIERARPEMNAYLNALELIRSRKRYIPSGEVTESRVWPQHTDYKVPPEFKSKQESIAMQYHVAGIKIKRKIKLSYGVFFDRGMLGYMLDDKCLPELLKCVYEDSLRKDYLELIERTKENNHHWIYCNGFSACLSQFETKEKFSRKEGKTIIEKKANYVITN